MARKICDCIEPSIIKLVDVEGNKFCTHCGGLIVPAFTKQRKIGLF